MPCWTLIKNQHPNNFSRGYPMSDPDPQECNCFDGTFLCTRTFGAVFWDLKGKSIESGLMPIESKQLKVDSNELKVSWFQLKSVRIIKIFLEAQKENPSKVDSNELKVNWFQLKPCLINRFLWGSKGKSIESRFKWIESKLISIEILSYH